MPIIAPAVERHCAKCRKLYRGERRVRVAFAGVAIVCTPCFKSGCRARRESDPFVEKARRTRDSHARRLGITPPDLSAIHGWDLRVIAEDMRVQYGTGCRYHRGPFRDPADLTLDVVDRDRPPDYRTNTHLCCADCNRAKGCMPPEDFEELLRVWAEWEANRTEAPLQLALGI